MKEGLHREAQLFSECLFGEQSRALIHAFFGERTVARIPDLTKDVTPLVVNAPPSSAPAPWAPASLSATPTRASQCFSPTPIPRPSAAPWPQVILGDVGKEGKF